MTAPVPPFDVALDDHGYMLDLGSQQWKHESIQLLRPAFISADRLGENDINPESLWRFSDRDWSHGAGQRRADLPDSDTSRFWKSRGVNVWDKWQVSLLPEFTHQGGPNAAATSARIFYVGTSLYLVNPSPEAGTPGLGFGFPAGPGTNVIESAAVFGACTDGATIYYSDSSEVASQAVGVAGAGSTYNAITGITQLYYLNGRLIGVSGSNSHVIDIHAAPDYDDLGALHGTYVPVDMTEAPNAIYVLGVKADNTQTQVFVVTVADDGTTLNPPVAVTPPFDGQGRRILYYEGLVFIGSTSGVRMATPNSDATLVVGPLIASGNCSALMGHNGKVWFGWDSYELDDTEGTYWSGFGRIDPSVINDGGAPAYASDVMASGFASSLNPVVLDVTYSDGLLVALTAAGVYSARLERFQLAVPALCASGYVRSGLISYDLPDVKAAEYLTVLADGASAGVITPALAVDGSETFTDLTAVPAGTTRQRSPIPDNPTGDAFELKVTLERDPDDHTQGAILTRTMLEADPIVASGQFLYVPILLCDPVADRNGNDQHVDVVTERTYLYGLRDNGTPVTYTELGYPPVQVKVEDITWVPTHRTVDNQGANGTVLLKLKTI